MNAVLQVPVWPKYPFGRMDVGDSFFMAEYQERVVRAACMWASRHPGSKFTTRKVKENGVCGTRVWRVA